jgi:hypothetical protein
MWVQKYTIIVAQIKSPFKPFRDIYRYLLIFIVIPSEPLQGDLLHNKKTAKVTPFNYSPPFNYSKITTPQG